MTLSSWFFILWISGFSASSLKQICCFVPQSFSVNFFNLILILRHQQELESAHKQEKLNLEHLHEKKVGKN